MVINHQESADKQMDQVNISDIGNILFYLIIKTSWNAWRCPWEKKIIRKKIQILFVAYVIPSLPMSVHKKFCSIRYSRLAGFREHTFECLVLFYRLTERPNKHFIRVAHDNFADISIDLQINFFFFRVSNNFCEIILILHFMSVTILN